MKWTIVILIGFLALILNVSNLVATDNTQDDTNAIKKAPAQTESNDNGVIAKTKNVISKAANKTNRAVRKAVNKTGNFFKRVGNKTRRWFKG